MKDNKESIALFVPTLLGGGAEKVFVNLANYFVEHKHKVWLLTSKQGIYFNSLNKEVEVYYINKPANFFVYYIYGIIQVAYFLWRHKPKIFMCTLTEAILIGSTAKKITFSKTAIILRQAFIVTTNNKIEKFFVKHLSRAYKNPDGIIANSPDTANSLTEKCGVKTEIKVLPNPVYNAEALNLAKEKMEKQVNDNFIVAVGNLKKEKNFECLINAFSIFRKKEESQKYHLVILGEGPERINLTKQIYDLGLEQKVHLLGFVKNPYPYLRNANAFVLSSDYEGFGNVLVEVLSVGTSIISTSCQGGPDYILNNGKYGKMVPVNDCELLADGISEVLKNPLEKDVLINRAKDFSVDMVGKKYLSYLRACAN